MKKKKQTNIIVNNIDVFLCDRIVAFGDSMVEGVELLDHTLPIANLKRKMDVYDWHNLIWEKDLIDQHLKNKEETKKLSYLAQLASLLKKNFINYGIGGNSLESIYWQMLYDFKPEPTDLILIGLPPLERLWKFINPECYDGNVHLGWTESYKEYGDTLVDWYSEPRLVFEYIKCLSAIRDYKNSIHSHVYVIPQWQTLKYITSNLSEDWKKPLTDVISQLYYSNLFISQKPLMDFSWVTRLEHGHPTLSAHVKMAQYINTHHIKLQ
jgi:hypothetical protein